MSQASSPCGWPGRHRAPVLRFDLTEDIGAAQPDPVHDVLSRSIRRIPRYGDIYDLTATWQNVVSSGEGSKLLRMNAKLSTTSSSVSIRKTLEKASSLGRAHVFLRVEEKIS